jgi:putative membrane protein
LREWDFGIERAPAWYIVLFCDLVVASGGKKLMRLLLNWILSGLAVWIVSRVVPGIYVSGPIAALVAALAIGFVNATIGLVLKILTFPLTLLTLGLFWFVINALMLKFASALVPGFQVHGFIAAFVGAIVLSLVNMLLKWMVYPVRENRY